MVLQFVVAWRCPSRRKHGEKKKLLAMSLLTSTASDFSIVTNWVFYSQQERQGGLFDALLDVLLASTVLGTLAWLVIVSDLRPVAWVAKKLRCRFSTGMFMFFAIVVDDFPQVTLSFVMDSLKAGQLEACGNIGALAVLNVMSSIYDLLIKMAEAYDALSDHHATGWVDQMIVKLQTDVEMDTADFGGRRLSTREVEQIAIGLKENHQVKELVMRGNVMTLTSCGSLGEAIKVNSVLTYLDISANGINNKGLTKIIEGMKGNKKLQLQHLYLAENEIGDEGTTQLALFLKTNTSLTILDLSSNRIQAKGAGEIWKALSPNPNAFGNQANGSLTTVHLSNNKLGDDGFFSFAGLKAHKALADLNLSLTGLTPKGCKNVAEVMKGSTSLTYLNLSDNTIGDEGARILAAALNPLQDKNAAKTLKNLVLDRCGISQAGAAAFKEPLTKTKTLTRLAMGGNEINEKTQTELRKLITAKSTIKEIHFGDTE